MGKNLVVAAVTAGVTWIAPPAMQADDRHTERYYDHDGHDFHTWDGQEVRAYRAYLGEQHRPFREFRKSNPSEQKEYFKWRHDHPDHVLFKVDAK